MDAPPSTLRADLRWLPRPVWFLLAGSFVNRFGSFVLPFLVLYLTHRGYTAAQSGLAISAYGIGSIAAAAVGGHLADRVGRRQTIAASMLSSAVVMIALSQAGDLGLILGLAALAGLTSESYRPASSALLADLVPAGRRVTAFAAYRFAINIGFAAGPAVAGLLAQHAFVLVFIGDAVTSAVFGVMALVLLPATHPAPTPAPVEARGATRTILSDVPFLLFLAATTIGAIVYFQQEAALPLQVLADGHSLAIYGSLISVNGLVVTAIELPFSSITRKFPPRHVIALGSILLGCGFGATALVVSTPALAATVVLWTFGEIVSAPVSSAYLADISPPHMRGRYAGAFSMTYGIGLIVGPAAGTAVFAASPGLLWGGCLALGGVSAVLMLIPTARPPGYATTASRSTSAA
ncbi:MAG TPA: MFS transporter [Gaiellales bacterium]